MAKESARFVRTLETAERDAEAARLRGRGLSFAEIGKQLGMSRQSATVAVKRALADVVGEVAGEVRDIELGRLDTLHLVRDADGRPLEDSMPRLAAIDRIVKVMERRVRLLGLDAPVKQDVRVTDVLDEQIRQLAAELGFMAALGDIRDEEDQV